MYDLIDQFNQKRLERNLSIAQVSREMGMKYKSVYRTLKKMNKGISDRLIYHITKWLDRPENRQ